jgi:hypothetical protein
MRYRKPFTPAQRREAYNVLRSLASNFNTIKRQFRPGNSRQRKLYRELRETIEQFSALLDAADDTVDIGALNRLRELATELSIQYVWERLSER